MKDIIKKLHSTAESASSAQCGVEGRIDRPPARRLDLLELERKNGLRRHAISSGLTGRRG
ncbi:hypothetical protein [Arenimonas alkanexedens]